MQAPNATTLGEALSRAVGRAREEAAPRSAGGSSPLVTLQGGAAGAAPLFCVPGAGSGVTSFVGESAARQAPSGAHPHSSKAGPAEPGAGSPADLDLPDST
jgi:hypothetical protein